MGNLFSSNNYSSNETTTPTYVYQNTEKTLFDVSSETEDDSEEEDKSRYNELEAKKYLKTEKRLDRYSMMIVSKYFKTKEDYLNMITVCKDYQYILDQFHYNPIPVKNKALFPQLETQHFYTQTDFKYQVEVSHKVIWYPLYYTDLMILKKTDNTILAKKVIYNEAFNYRVTPLIPKEVTSLGTRLFTEVRCKEMTVPSQVTSLLCQCFTGCHFQTIILPPSVIRIEDYCFYQCNDLKELEMTPSVNTLGQHWIDGCYSLTQIHIPNCRTFFAKVDVFTSRFLEDQNIHCEEIEFSDNDCALRQRNHVSPVIPTFITKLEEFTCSPAINSFTVPKNVIVIGEKAFSSSRATKIVIENGVKKIGRKCFERCSWLKEINFPSSVDKLHRDCLRGCTALTRVAIQRDLFEKSKNVFANLQTINFIF
ncbi:hypothetical protein EIN_497870 [Entamoeba invadens IP1]|uniref:Leucine rich repeat containing protein BspA family protein n=1 Tax=Entamoeba invadens IP1 TaxID=370355 RepID=A0A0A1UDG9_ENTIV|nr:hypothetical protein EIN_497870 [Entamoeba invadens IP1]ELP94607.1 hypothetical protein EIN_497870 [Entamoeba invadens IP1]|eukprot:XP_004261378.1 hypothetical protein EIN_497870 [Entamoeba invadens IP1]